MRPDEKPFFNAGNTQTHVAVWIAGLILDTELCFMERRALEQGLSQTFHSFLFFQNSKV
jgi:hypothetical protein